MRSITSQEFYRSMLRGVRGKQFREALTRVLDGMDGSLEIKALGPYEVELRVNDSLPVKATYSNKLVELSGAPDGAYWPVNVDRLNFETLVAYANP